MENTKVKKRKVKKSSVKAITKTKNEDISKKYKKKSQREHLILRPGMYMGGIYNTLEEVWTLEDQKMVKKNMMFNPGILKLFDEVIMNAADHADEYPDKVTEIRVNVNKSEGFISVYNNGPGIPTIIHTEHNIPIPQLIFSEFLTGTNYEDNQERLKAGLNGLGAKITSTYSKKFIIETVSDGKWYNQTFCDNLENIEPPIIKNSKKKEFTKITFYPDFNKFKIKKINDVTFKLLERRTYDVAAFTNKKVSLFFNDVKLEIKTFDEYTNLFLPEKFQKEKIIIENDRWKIAICTSPYEEFNQVSFVNGVHTSSGGTHVKYVVDPMVRKIIEKLQKKIKEITIKPSFLKDNMFVFIFASIVNPSFKSQAKEELTTKSAEFGSTFTIDEQNLKKIEKMEMINRMMELVRFKENKALSASDGKKKIKISGVPKLDDANSAGGKKSKNCTLILTEGDSAKTFATSGIKLIGRDLYGIFPLKGKLLNVRDANKSQLLKNEEIKNLKIILGLQNGKKFNTVEELKNSMRYGHILILTDQDVDGSHIKGLLINFFHFFWPQLIIEDNFVTCLQTPIVKATKGSTTNIFYNIPEYRQWKLNSTGKWKIKYYKGLGTSTASEAKECFKDLKKKQVFYEANEDFDEECIKLAFQKDKADDRKKWILNNSGKEVFINNKLRKIPLNKFFNQEMVLFSIEDCERSIPNIMDGLKPSQRKVLYGTIKKNTIEELKVDQLRGYIGEKTAYHHGDKSLNETIVGMNHDYVGSNNINLLIPCGQLGTRLMGGKDAASARYISTKINPITRTIFSTHDDNLLNYKNDDGYTIEPTYFWPSIPMILVNGSSGIGTGYATDIPKYNPIEIINTIKKLIENKNYGIPEMKPWYKNFQGTIEKDKKKGTYRSYGKWERKDRSTLIITELPIGTWTQNYKNFLDKILNEGETITDVYDDTSDTTIYFELKAPSLKINEWIENDKIIKMFKLSDNIPLNLTLFDENEKIVVFNSPEEILYHFFKIRKELYKKRYTHITKEYQKNINLVQSKVLFIQKIISGEIKVFRITKAKIVEQLQQQKFPKIKNQTGYNYQYLLDMKIHNFTQEKITILEKELTDMQTLLKTIKSKTYKDLWIEDLNNLQKKL